MMAETGLKHPHFMVGRNQRDLRGKTSPKIRDLDSPAQNQGLIVITLQIPAALGTKPGERVFLSFAH